MINRLIFFGNNTYVYNSDGIRIKKTVSNVVHDYFVEGEKIVGEKIGDQEISYLYDLTGITGIKTGPSESQLYFFQKNVLGDIVAIVDWFGNIVARYYYDAWGNVLRITDNSGNEI